MIKLTLYKSLDPSQPLTISANTLLDLMRQLMTWMDENNGGVGPPAPCQVDGLTMSLDGHVDDFIGSRCVVLAHHGNWFIDVDNTRRSVRYTYATWNEAKRGFVCHNILSHAAWVAEGTVEPCGVFEPYPETHEINQVCLDLFW